MPHGALSKVRTVTLAWFKLLQEGVTTRTEAFRVSPVLLETKTIHRLPFAYYWLTSLPHLRELATATKFTTATDHKQGARPDGVN